MQGKGNDWTSEPEDRVASWVYTEMETSAGLRKGTEPTWDNKSPEQVNELLNRFGACPEHL